MYSITKVEMPDSGGTSPTSNPLVGLLIKGGYAYDMGFVCCNAELYCNAYSYCYSYAFLPEQR